MKTIVQLLIVVLLFNAAFQAAKSYYDYYQFKHDVREQAVRGIDPTTDALHQRIVTMAGERGFDMSWNDVDLSVRNDEVAIDMKYVDDIPFIPRVYTRPWTFETTIQARRVKPLQIIPH